MQLLPPPPSTIVCLAPSLDECPGRGRSHTRTKIYDTSDRSSTVRTTGRDRSLSYGRKSIAYDGRSGRLRSLSRNLPLSDYDVGSGRLRSLSRDRTLPDYSGNTCLRRLRKPVSRPAAATALLL